MQVVVKTQFEDIHKWENAPDVVAFLRNEHRHIFYVEVKCFVKHDDREIEFFMLKNNVDSIIRAEIKTMPVTKSCEMMASKLKAILQDLYSRDFIVSIFEDGENGVIV